MIDFLTLELINQEANELINNDKLVFSREYTIDGEEKGNCYTAKFDGLKLSIYDSGLILLKGSFHKTKNGNRHNYDDFYFYQLLHEVERIEHEYKLSLMNANIKSIEFGVNITPPRSTRKILDGIMYYKTKRFEFERVGRRGLRGNFKVAELQRFRIKFYDKRVQYNLVNELLRYEIKVKKMAYLEKLGLSTISDLKHQNLRKGLGKILTDVWNQVLIYDFTINSRDQSDSKLIDKYSNPNYWSKLRETVSRKKYLTEVKRCEIISSENGDDLKRILGIRFKKKWDLIAHTGLKEPYS
ncbi:MAG: hypothetical protein RLO12_18765 [Fulvivirga sp.]